MRDKNLNFIQFCDQIESFISRKLNSIEILRRAVVNSPTLLSEDYYLKLVSNKLQGLRGLAVISYYLPEILRWKVHEVLEEKVKYLSLKDQKKLLLMISSREVMLTFLYETQEFSSHEIFGNLINDGLYLLRHLKIIKSTTKVKVPKRKRGYDDKGSLRSSDRWLPSFDYSLTEQQNQIEKRQYLHLQTITYLEQFLCEKFIYLRENLSE